MYSVVYPNVPTVKNNVESLALIYQYLHIFGSAYHNINYSCCIISHIQLHENDFQRLMLNHEARLLITKQ